jgi:hypothetical protein
MKAAIFDFGEMYFEEGLGMVPMRPSQPLTLATISISNCSGVSVFLNMSPAFFSSIRVILALALSPAFRISYSADSLPI